MDTARMLSELREERNRINQAINALEALDRTPTAARKRVGRPKGSGVSVKGKGGITAAGRKRLSEMMKQRWAERKKNARVKSRSAA